MSIQAYVWAERQTVGDSKAKFVLMALADTAGVDHRVSINFERLSRITELPPLKVGNALFRLQDLGLLDGEYLAVPEDFS